MDIVERLRQYAVIPVVALDDAKDAEKLAGALCNGGLACAEVTFRTAAAKESIQIMSTAYPDMLVGAGTVINVEQVKEAVSVGAKFIVSPGYNDEVVEYCVNSDIPVFPGIVTPTEIMKAISAGLEVVKFFPASVFGGLTAIKALSGPFPNMKFIPTGGVNAKNLSEYLESNKVFGCGGTWLAKKDLINNGEFDKIEALTREAVEIVKTIRI